jgi:hypothetical protein
MDIENQPEQLKRNPKTHAIHKREVFWQITMPLLVGILLILAAVGAIVFSTLQPITEVGRWASVSLMWLILPALIFALLFLALVAGLIYAVSFLLGVIPHYTLMIQLYIEQARSKIGQLLDLSTEPILRLRSMWAVIRYASRGRRKPAHE